MLWVLENQELIIEIRSYTIVGGTEELKDQKGSEKKSLNNPAVAEKGFAESCKRPPREQRRCQCEAFGSSWLLSSWVDSWTSSWLAGPEIYEETRSCSKVGTSGNSVSLPHYLKRCWLSKCCVFYFTFFSRISHKYLLGSVFTWNHARKEILGNIMCLQRKLTQYKITH